MVAEHGSTISNPMTSVIVSGRLSAMIAVARGSITEPQKLGPFIDEEMRVVAQLKAEGVIRVLYRRAAGPGTVIILEADSLDAMRERMSTLPFVAEGLMSLEYEEVYEI